MVQFFYFVRPSTDADEFRRIFPRTRIHELYANLGKFAGFCPVLNFADGPGGPGGQLYGFSVQLSTNENSGRIRVRPYPVRRTRTHFIIRFSKYVRLCQISTTKNSNKRKTKG